MFRKMGMRRGPKPRQESVPVAAAAVDPGGNGRATASRRQRRQPLQDARATVCFRR